MLAVTLRVALASWEAVPPPGTVGVPLPEGLRVGLRVEEAHREGCPEAEKVLLLQGVGVSVALLLVHRVGLPVAQALALWHRLMLGVADTVLQGLAATVPLRVPPPAARLAEAL